MGKIPSPLGGWKTGMAEVTGLSPSFSGTENHALLSIYSFVFYTSHFLFFHYSTKAVECLKCASVVVATGD